MNIVTDNNFEEILASNDVCVIDFSATWCVPCKKLAPDFEELAGKYEGKAFIGKVNIEDSPEVTEKCEIYSVPTVIFFKNGVVQTDRIVGAHSKSEYENRILELI
ncbi:MAG: thioredoxin family protein [Prevotellaceae bacterium]|jgi:thioredoxin 1|nr:thioredoxin family protein [Prevotellaceae bacterium]